MADLNLAVEILKLDEGFSGTPYRCTGGALTIAYGRNLDANPLTEEEGEYLLRRDVAECITSVASIIGLDRWQMMGECQRAALVNMRYQLGKEGFAGFGDMLASIAVGEYRAAAGHALDSLWARKQTPSRANRVALALAENVDAWKVG